MKASIITFHCVPNFGAMLQAYAMQRLFAQYFDEVEVLDYRPPYLLRPYKFRTDTFLGRLSSLLNLPTNCIRYGRFKEFMRTNLKLSNHSYYNYDAIKTDSNCLILGSDQIWNLSILDTVDRAYFGLIPSSKCKRIAYAASIGSEDIRQTELDVYRELIEGLSYIGVREKQAKDILLSAGVSTPISIVLDPTLMINPSVWRELEHKTRMPKHYVLVYSLCGYKSTFDCADKLSQMTGMPIIEILGRDVDFRNKKKHRQIATFGPQEFLYAIDNADYFVTDSFHGTAFSIIFRKKFLVDPHKKRGSRMRELLEKLNLNSHIIEEGKQQDINCLSFNEEQESLLIKYQKESLAFIENAVEGLFLG